MTIRFGDTSCARWKCSKISHAAIRAAHHIEIYRGPLSNIFWILLSFLLCHLRHDRPASHTEAPRLRAIFSSRACARHFKHDLSTRALQESSILYKELHDEPTHTFNVKWRMRTAGTLTSIYFTQQLSRRAIFSNHTPSATAEKRCGPTLDRPDDISRHGLIDDFRANSSGLS